MLVEIWLVKAIMMRSQMEMWNMLLETGKKTDPCYKVVKKVAELLFSSVLWKVELVRNKIGILAGKISKQSVKDVAWLCLNAYNKIWEERSDLKIELLS